MKSCATRLALPKARPPDPDPSPPAGRKLTTGASTDARAFPIHRVAGLPTIRPPQYRSKSQRLRTTQLVQQPPNPPRKGGFTASSKLEPPCVPMTLWMHEIIRNSWTSGTEEAAAKTRTKLQVSDTPTDDVEELRLRIRQLTRNQQTLMRAVHLGAAAAVAEEVEAYRDEARAARIAQVAVHLVASAVDLDASHIACCRELPADKWLPGARCNQPAGHEYNLLGATYVTRCGIGGMYTEATR